MPQNLRDNVPDDAALVAEIAGAPHGSATAAESDLYRKLAPRVRLYGLRHLRDEQAAADLMQQVMLMTIERLRAGKLRDPSRLASFVLGMCRMVVLDLKRGQRRRDDLLLRYGDDLPLSDASEPLRLDHNRLQACLERLGERERAVLVMSFFDECSAEQVSRELGVSAGYVRVIRHRGIERLRECVSAGGWPA
jgi:RNA polymerase sigma-70 factor (ECF subfamily)